MNPEQQRVIDHGDGPLAVLAGAGTGKTATIVARVQRLVESGEAPHRILVVTFSKDAARELEARCGRAGLQGVDVATWHSLAYRILREDETDFATWEVDSSGALLRRLISEACGPKGIDWADADEAGLLRFMGLAAANLWTRADGDARAQAARIFGPHTMIALAAWDEVTRLTNERRVLTFDRMLVEAVRHLQEESTRAWWAARWRHVLQDEGQDANKAQIAFARALAEDHRRYVVVGDPAQAIYGFRGSSPSHLLGFPETWSAPVVSLVRNYRSGSAIVDVGNAIIAPSAQRLPERLVAERPLTGSVSLVTADDDDDEAKQLAEHIAREKANGARWADFAVLWRTNAQSRAVEEALMRAGIPHVIVGARPFFARREVRALLAYLRVATDRAGAGDLRDCINAPSRFLGRVFVEHVLVHRQDGAGWREAVLLSAAQTRIWSKQKTAATAWADLIERIATMERTLRPIQLLEEICARTEYLEWLKRDQGEGDEGDGRSATVMELLRVAARYPTVKQFLDFVDQAERVAAKREEVGDRVMCSSIHRAKGLEWPRVWVIGWADGTLPHAKGDLEEERRLAYVAATRARDELILSWPSSQGQRDLAPSPFLFDAGLIKLDDVLDEKGAAA